MGNWGFRSNRRESDVPGLPEGGLGRGQVRHQEWQSAVHHFTPCIGFQSTNWIGRKGRFLESDDGNLFDWRTGQWITAISGGGAESDPPWCSSAGHTFEALRAGWIRISRKDALDRFVKLPCGAFCVHSGTNYLIGGLNRRRLMAWRCMDLAAKGLEKLLP
jgi:hypothetical protein